VEYQKLWTGRKEVERFVGRLREFGCYKRSNRRVRRTGRVVFGAALFGVALLLLTACGDGTGSNGTGGSGDRDKGTSSTGGSGDRDKGTSGTGGSGDRDKGTSGTGGSDGLTKKDSPAADQYPAAEQYTKRE
jgi:hypothetical protein